MCLCIPQYSMLSSLSKALIAVGVSIPTDLAAYRLKLKAILKVAPFRCSIVTVG